MFSHVKLKLALPVLAAVLSTSAFAAGDVYAALPKDGAADNHRNSIAVFPGSNSSADMYANSRTRTGDRPNNLVASLSPNNSKARSASSSAAGEDNAVMNDIALAKEGDMARARSIPDQQSNVVDTCMGSKSSGIQLPVVGGITIGSSWTDKNCMMIKNARELWNMGYKTAALARMCMDDGNREALESTGTPCPPRRIEAASK